MPVKIVPSGFYFGEVPSIHGLKIGRNLYICASGPRFATAVNPENGKEWVIEKHRNGFRLFPILKRNHASTSINKSNALYIPHP